ncbi:MAG: hypothetical protein WC101_00285 [Candidatus Gracilibacteria bacterium]
MSLSAILKKEKIVSMSELQRNPSKALTGSIIRIVKNGKEIGIFLSKAEFDDLMEEQADLKPKFQKELRKSLKNSKKGTLKSLSEIL